MAPVYSKKDKTVVNSHPHDAWSQEPTIFPPVQYSTATYQSAMELAPSNILQTTTTSTTFSPNQAHQKRRVPELKRIDHISNQYKISSVAPYIESFNRDKQQLQNKVRSLNINSLGTPPQLENSSATPNDHHVGNVHGLIFPKRTSELMNKANGGSSEATALQSHVLCYSKGDSPSTPNLNLLYVTTDSKQINQLNSQETLNFERPGILKNVEKFADSQSNAKFGLIGSDQAPKTSNASPVNRMYHENIAATRGFFNQTNLITSAEILQSHNLYYPNSPVYTTADLKHVNQPNSQENNFGRDNSETNVRKFAGTQSYAQPAFINNQRSNIPQLAEQFSTQLVQEYLNYLIYNRLNIHVLNAQKFLTLKYSNLKGLANSSNSFSLNQLAKITLTARRTSGALIPKDIPVAARKRLEPSPPFYKKKMPISQAYELLQNLHHGQNFAEGPVIKTGQRQNVMANTASFSTQRSPNLMNSIQMTQNSTIPISSRNIQQHDKNEPIIPPLVAMSNIAGNHNINQRSLHHGVTKKSVQQTYNNSAKQFPYLVPRDISSAISTTHSQSPTHVDLTHEFQNILKNKTAMHITTNYPTQSNENIHAKQITVTDARKSQIPMTNECKTNIPVPDAIRTKIPVADERGTNIPVTDAFRIQIPVTDTRKILNPVTDARNTNIPVTKAHRIQIPGQHPSKTQFPMTGSRGTIIIPVTDTREMQIPVTDARGTQIPMTNIQGTQITVSDKCGTSIPLTDVCQISMADIRETQISESDECETQIPVNDVCGTQIPVIDAHETQIPVKECNISQNLSTRRINATNLNSLNAENKECISGESLRKIFNATSGNAIELESSLNKSQVPTHSATDVTNMRPILPSTNTSDAEHELLPNKPQNADYKKICGIEMLLQPAHKISLEYWSPADKRENKGLNNMEKILTSSYISAVDQKSLVDGNIGVPMSPSTYQNPSERKSPSEPQVESLSVNSNEKSYTPENDTDTEAIDMQSTENQSSDQESLTEEDFLDEFTSLLCELDSHNSSTNNLFERLQDIITNSTETSDSLKKVFNDNLKTSDDTVSSTTSSEPV